MVLLVGWEYNRRALRKRGAVSAKGTAISKIFMAAGDLEAVVKLLCRDKGSSDLCDGYLFHFSYTEGAGSHLGHPYSCLRRLPLESKIWASP